MLFIHKQLTCSRLKQRNVVLMSVINIASVNEIWSLSLALLSLNYLAAPASIHRPVIDTKYHQPLPFRQRRRSQLSKRFHDDEDIYRSCISLVKAEITFCG